MSQLSDRISFRCSSGLRDLINQSGDESAVTRTLVILGLAAHGEDVTHFRTDLIHCVSKITDIALQTTVVALLRGEMFNRCSTDVQQTVTAISSVPARVPSVETGAELDDDDPFEGFDV